MSIRHHQPFTLTISGRNTTHLEAGVQNQHKQAFIPKSNGLCNGIRGAWSPLLIVRKVISGQMGKIKMNNSNYSGDDLSLVDKIMESVIKRANSWFPLKQSLPPGLESDVDSQSHQLSGPTRTLLFEGGSEEITRNHIILPTTNWHLPSPSTRIKSWAHAADLQHPLNRVQGRDQEWCLCTLEKTVRTGLQILRYFQKILSPILASPHI